MTTKFDLEERTFRFAKRVQAFLSGIRKNAINHERVPQLLRSSASVGANYIEANEALSSKDFINRVKICRKEAKESAYWLRLLDSDDAERDGLLQEARELTLIFAAILRKLGAIR